MHAYLFDMNVGKAWRYWRSELGIGSYLERFGEAIQFFFRLIIMAILRDRCHSLGILRRIWDPELWSMIEYTRLSDVDMSAEYQSSISHVFPNLHSYGGISHIFVLGRHSHPRI